MFSPSASRFDSIIQENLEKHHSFNHITAFKSVIQAGAQDVSSDFCIWIRATKTMAFL